MSPHGADKDGMHGQRDSDRAKYDGTSKNTSRKEMDKRLRDVPTHTLRDFIKRDKDALRAGHVEVYVRERERKEAPEKPGPKDKPTHDRKP